MVHRAAQSSCGDASDPALPASLTLKFSHLTSPPLPRGLWEPPDPQPWFSLTGLRARSLLCGGRGVYRVLPAPVSPAWMAPSRQAGHARGALESEDSMGRAAMPRPTSCVTMGKSQDLSEPWSLFCKKGATIVFLLSGGCEEETTQVKYLAPRPVLQALVIPVKHVG